MCLSYLISDVTLLIWKWVSQEGEQTWKYFFVLPLTTRTNMGYSEKRLALPLSPEERPEHSDLSTKKLTKLLKTLTFLAFIVLVYYGTSDYDGKAHRDTSAPHVHRKLSTEEKENLFL